MLREHQGEKTAQQVFLDRVLLAEDVDQQTHA